MPGKHITSENRVVQPLMLKPHQRIALRRDEAPRQWQPRIPGADDPQSIFKKANPVVDILSALNGDEDGELPYFDMSPVLMMTPGVHPAMQRNASMGAEFREYIVHSPFVKSPSGRGRDAQHYAVWKAFRQRRILQTILNRLSREGLRSAALVNRSWNTVATQFMWETVMVDSVRRILLTLPEWDGESRFTAPPDWTRFNRSIGPCIHILRIDLRCLCDSVLLRELLESMGKLKMPYLQILDVSFHGYDRYQLELAMRFACESVRSGMFTVYFKTAPSTATRDILKTFQDSACERMPNLDEFNLVLMWGEDRPDPVLEFVMREEYFPVS